MNFPYYCKTIYLIIITQALATHALHLYFYICNTLVHMWSIGSSTHVIHVKDIYLYHVCYMCIACDLHMYYMCINYMCDTQKHHTHITYLSQI